MDTNKPKEIRSFVTREDLRKYLNSLGYPITATYFNKLCLPSRNAGPPVAIVWGKRPLYTKEEGLKWAEGRCRMPQ